MQEIELSKLTIRQRQVLAHLLRGVGERRTAYLLGISVNTVHSHVRGIYAAFEVHSLTELMSLLLQGGVEISRYIEL